MIKYLGSKRSLVPALGKIASASGATTGVDLFTGTTRVAQEFKRQGLFVTANDIASYSEVLAQTYIALDAASVDMDELDDVLDELNHLPGRRGYFTETFCEKSRYFQPANGMKIDAIRDAIEVDYGSSWMRPVLLTSLMQAADKVDSTTGVQMAYLKKWASRAYNPIKLLRPQLLPGSGVATRQDAAVLATTLPPQQLVYVDPPYNQHQYFANYHIWETLIRWDEPDTYGVACKRVDARNDENKSIYNRKRHMPSGLAALFDQIDTELLVVSYNNESWITVDEMVRFLREGGFDAVRFIEFDYRRYVGSRIGIYNPSGVKVGKISHTRNVEYLFLAGVREIVDRCADAVSENRD